MDNTELYIKMCDKAFKYIGFLPDNGCPSQFDTKDRMQWYGHSLLLSSSDSDICRANEQITGQIYRQDQLQEMVIGDYVSPGKMFSAFGRWYDEEGDYTLSAEQLWLVFVMKEKYNKSWNSEDWITVK